MRRTTRSIPALRVLCGACALAALVIGAPPARSQEPAPRSTGAPDLPRAASRVKRATLSWVRLPGAESCIASPALAEAVEERLGHPVFVSAKGATLAVEGWIAPAERPLKWRAIVTIADERGEVLGSRELLADSASCDEIVPKLSLVIALLVDPDRVDPEPIVPPASPPETEPRDKAPSPLPAAPKEGPPAAPLDPLGGVRTEVTLGPTMGLGVLPSAASEPLAFGALLRVVVGSPRWWGVVAEAAYFPRKSPAPSSWYEMERVQGAILGCPLRGVLGVRWSVCGGAAAGFFVVRTASGIGGRAWTTPAFVDGLLDVRATYRPSSSPLLATMGARLGVPFASDVYFGSGVNYTLPPAYGAIDVSVGFELP